MKVIKHLKDQEMGESKTIGIVPTFFLGQVEVGHTPMVNLTRFTTSQNQCARQPMKSVTYFQNNSLPIGLYILSISAKSAVYQPHIKQGLFRSFIVGHIVSATTLV